MLHITKEILLSFYKLPLNHHLSALCELSLIFKSGSFSHFVFQAPSQPPGNVVWNATDTKVLLNWEQVKAMENESEVTGYKVRFCNAFFSYSWQGKLSLNDFSNSGNVVAVI